MATLCDVSRTSSRRGEHAVIGSGWGSALPRRLVLVAVAALIPVLAGCEAGNNAPTLDFHYPTDAAGTSVGDLAIRNVFVLGAPLGRDLARGQSASVFLALVNNGAPDKLISITAPGTAASVTLPGSIPVVIGHPVFSHRPAAAGRPHRPDPAAGERHDHQAGADVPEGRPGHAARPGDGPGHPLRDLRAAAADHPVGHTATRGSQSAAGGTPSHRRVQVPARRRALVPAHRRHHRLARAASAAPAT